jgi:iron only hydrogenase large subunit-like protein
MLEKQSLDDFLSNIDKGKAIIVSLSPQSRASLAVYFGISPLQVVSGFYLKGCAIR